MKKFLCMLLLAVMAVSAGCGGETAETKAAKKEIDVDLTKMSSTMVYSEVSNMVSNPDQYLGKRVRMNGVSTVYTDPATGQVYYTCLIQDATACCSQGIEFVLKDGNYPEAGTEVVVTGKFATYYEGEYRYCTLKNAVLE